MEYLICKCSAVEGEGEIYKTSNVYQEANILLVSKRGKIIDYEYWPTVEQAKRAFKRNIKSNKALKWLKEGEKQ